MLTYNVPTKPFAYGDYIIARVHCVDMELLDVKVTLWEDDGDKYKQKNNNVKIDSKLEMVINGIATVSFYLDPSHAWLANAKLAKGDKDEGELHEYYVTAEIFEKIPLRSRISSKNTNVPNPDYKPPVSEPKKPTPAQQKGPSKKEKKGIVTSENKVHDYHEQKVAVNKTINTTPVHEETNSALTVFMDSSEDGEKKKSTCDCKENNFYWSNKLTCDQRKKVLQVCANIWGESKKKEKASELMAIMHLETNNTFSPSKKGVSAGGTKYIGLIQFSATTAQSIGTTYEDLEKMTFIQQMDYVEKYLKQNKDKMKTIVDFYLQVIKPSDVGKGDQPDYAVFDESITVPDGDGSKTSKEQRLKNITREPWVTKYGYASNPTFMKEKDETIKRKKWVYTRQQFEDRAGFHNGKTTIKEIDDVLRLEHYNKGASELFNGICDNVEEEKKEETLGERAPWMEVVVNEAKNYGGKKQSSIQDRITIYHKDGASYLSKKDAWCSSFACWCLENTNPPYPSPHSPGSRSFINNKTVEKCEAFYGAIATFSDCNKEGIVESSGHVTFVYGKINDTNNYAVLGGNQNNMIKVSSYDCSGNVFYSHYSSNRKREIYKKFMGFFKPKGYEIKEIDKLTESDVYSNPDEANNKIGLSSIKTVKGEKDD